MPAGRVPPHEELEQPAPAHPGRARGAHSSSTRRVRPPAPSHLSRPRGSEGALGVRGPLAQRLGKRRERGDEDNRARALALATRRPTSVLPVPHAMIYARRVRDLECRNGKSRGFRLLARHDRGVPPADTLLASCESPARMRFRSTGSDPVGAAPVVRPMSAALNGSGRRKTASRRADEQHC
jgi:hypothetical protein